MSFVSRILRESNQYLLFKPYQLMIEKNGFQQWMARNQITSYHKFACYKYFYLLFILIHHYLIQDHKKPGEFVLNDAGMEFVENVIAEIERRGVDTEGIYRLVGVSSRVDRLMHLMMDPKTRNQYVLQILYYLLMLISSHFCLLIYNQ